MMTSSNGNIFRVTGLLCGEFTGPGEFPTQRPVTRSFDVYFDLRLNKPLSKQPWGWWFETLSRSLWRHRNALEHRLFNCCNVIPVLCDTIYAYALDHSTNPTMQQSHIPQCAILKQKCAHVCTYLLQNDALWDICLEHCWICEISLLS